MKKCNICNKEKPQKDYYANPGTTDKLGSHCKECHRELSARGYKRMRAEIGEEKWKERSRLSMRKWRSNNIEKAREKATFYRNKYREKYNETRRNKLAQLVKSVLLSYGGKCVCCSESDWRFLSLDHIKGDGNKHRKSSRISNLALWAYKNDYPNILQILCFNCNFGRQARGGKNKICPHKLSSN